MSFKELIQSMRGSHYTLLLSAMFASIAVMGTFKCFIKPQMDKTRREEARTYADFVFRQEQARLQK